jgi:NDP-sugar pyrophosphorylase family protein
MRQAVILAGGKGERLRPYTEDRPKAMIELLGSPIMAYQLHWLRSYGFQRVVIACGYRHEIIESHFGDGSKWGLKIEYEIESEPLGRGGALKKALKRIGGFQQPVLAINGDGITNLKIDDLFAFHEKHKPVATLATFPLRSPYGIVDIDDDRTIRGFREKPELPFGVNAGMYVLEPEIVALLPDKGDHEDLTFPQLAEQGRLKAFQSNSFWRTVDTAKDLTELRSELEKMFLSSFFTAADRR